MKTREKIKASICTYIFVGFIVNLVLGSSYLFIEDDKIGAIDLMILNGVIAILDIVFVFIIIPLFFKICDLVDRLL